MESSIPDKIYPVFIGEMIGAFTKGVDVFDKAFNICFDLWKINSDNIEAIEKVDLCGHEDSPTKAELAQRLENEVALIKTA